MLFKREVKLGKGSILFARSDEAKRTNNKIIAIGFGELQGRSEDITVAQLLDLEAACREVRQHITSESTTDGTASKSAKAS